VQALRTIPRHGVDTVDAPLQERVKSRKNCIVFISVIENPLKVYILLSRATYTNTCSLSAGILWGDSTDLYENLMNYIQ
jgi:hypothetical protein